MPSETGGRIKQDALPNGWPILQSSGHFCFTMDAVLLAAFPILRRPLRIAELGSGTGAISLLLCARNGGCRVTGIELDPVLSGLCRHSIELNSLQEQAEILTADVRAIKALLPSGQFSLVVANPPYREKRRGRLRQGEMAQACHEVAGDTADFIKAATWLLKNRGYFCLVQLPERLPELLEICRQERLEPKRLRFVHAGPDKPPSIFLLEAVKGAKPGLAVLPPLFVYNKDGGYTDELLDCYAVFGEKNG